MRPSPGAGVSPLIAATDSPNGAQAAEWRAPRVMRASDIDEALQQALLLHGAGRPVQAEALYRSILEAEPRFAPALQNLGAALIEQGRHAEALERLEDAIRLAPDNAVALSNRGNALTALGRPAEALASYARAIEIDPTYARAYSNRCEPLTLLGRHEEALASAERALRLQPRLAAALHNRGQALAMLHRPEEALRSFDEALEIRPDWPLALAHRSHALLRLRGTAAALDDARRAVQLAPHDPIALNSRGNALRALQRYEEALASYDGALAARPAFATAHHNRGNVLLDLQRPSAALESFERALELDPAAGRAHHDRGVALLRLERLEEAAAAFERALELEPDLPFARGRALHARLQQADWRGYEAAVASLEAAVACGARADEPLSFLAVSGSAAVQSRCARACLEEDYSPVLPPLAAARRDGHDRIRIAYLSGDFGEHPVSYLMAGVFERHDRRGFETIGISLRREAGPYGRRIRAAFDRFVEAGSRTDEDVARLICEMQVDIAVDLMGFTRGTRLGVLARRPAPLQVSYLGYPGTLGAAYIDYLIADEYVVPPAVRPHYAERIAFLPDCFQANDDRRALPALPTRAQAGLPESGQVFCAFNASYKVTPAIFAVWCRLLTAAPDSVLWLLAERSSTRANLRLEAEARGVAPERLIFAGRVGYEEHLARLQLADLFLDTSPFNAGASASDALWAAVPVLTCPGEAFAARMAGSLLRAVSLPQLICESLEHYEHRALELAGDPSQLRAIKAWLQEHRRRFPLFDTTRFCRHLERAYRAMHERAHRGEDPVDISVEPIDGGGAAHGTA